MAVAAGNLIWIDLEMSGLDPETCTIIEIATIVTDSQLEIVAEGPCLVIHQPDAVIEAMDEWNTTHHGASGLIDAVRASTIDLAEAERQTIGFISQHVARGAS
ncbi:MAG: oligoribonuclease, partial [Salinibacterium sp.]|nr:oligoribonuclease [Salinibacterium sp.]